MTIQTDLAQRFLDNMQAKLAKAKEKGADSVRLDLADLDLLLRMAGPTAEAVDRVVTNVVDGFGRAVVALGEAAAAIVGTEPGMERLVTAKNPNPNRPVSALAGFGASPGEPVTLSGAFEKGPLNVPVTGSMTDFVGVDFASGPDQTVITEVRQREDGTFDVAETTRVNVRLPNPLDMHGACDEFGGQDAAPKERLDG